MSLKMNSSPYQRSPRTTLQIMLELSAALLLVWIAAVIYNFTLSAELGLRAILLMVVALVTTAVIDAVVALIRHKKGNNILKEVIDSVVHNYSYVTAIIFTLCCPVYVTYYVIIIGCLFSTGIKHCFGGFGKNIFNPAIIGRIVTGIAFTSEFNTVPSYVDSVSSATVTSQYSNLGLKWLSNSLPENFDFGRILLGNYIGAMGETFTILLIVLGIVLIIRNIINWRTTVFYLGTVILSALSISLFVEGLNPLNYIIYHLSLGGLMFGAIFMITDPVTSPTSPFGKALIGVIAGLLTVLIRVAGGYPEGVMYSIALVNLISPVIDKLVVGRTTDGHIKKWTVIGGLVAGSILINTALSVSALNASNNNSTSLNSSTIVESNSSSSSVKLTEEEKLFGIVGAEYTEINLGELPDNTKIEKVYLAKVNGVDKALSYKLKTTWQWYEHLDLTISPVIGVSISLENDTIIGVGASGSYWTMDESYGTETINFLNKFVGQTSSSIASMEVDSDYTAGATNSTKTAFNLLIEATKQYSIDKLCYLFGTPGVNYESFTMTNNNEKITNAYTFENDNQKFIGYIVNENTPVNVSFHGSLMGTIKPKIAIIINLANDKITDLKVLSGKTTEGYDMFSQDPETFVKNILIEKTATEIANLDVDSTYDVSATATNGAGAIYSVNSITKLAVNACSQYINNDKAILIGGGE